MVSLRKTTVQGYLVRRYADNLNARDRTGASAQISPILATHELFAELAGLTIDALSTDRPQALILALDLFEERIPRVVALRQQLLEVAR